MLRQLVRPAVEPLPTHEAANSSHSFVLEKMASAGTGQDEQVDEEAALFLLLTRRRRCLAALGCRRV